MFDSPETFEDLVLIIIGIFSKIIPLIFSITLVVIIWKVVSAWIINAGDPSKIEEGKNAVLIGIIALVIMSSIWGILALLRSSLV